MESQLFAAPIKIVGNLSAIDRAPCSVGEGSYNEKGAAGMNPQTLKGKFTFLM
jgi:hypothetical protein